MAHRFLSGLAYHDLTDFQPDLLLVISELWQGPQITTNDILCMANILSSLQEMEAIQRHIALVREKQSCQPVQGVQSKNSFISVAMRSCITCLGFFRSLLLKQHFLIKKGGKKKHHAS